MSAKRYKVVMRICLVVAVAATLVFDRFEGSRIVSSVMGLAASVTAVLVYFYNRSTLWSSEYVTKEEGSRTGKEPEYRGESDPPKLVFGDLDLSDLNAYLSRHFSHSLPSVVIFVRGPVVTEPVHRYSTARVHGLSKRTWSSDEEDDLLDSLTAEEFSSRKTMLH